MEQRILPVLWGFHSLDLRPGPPLRPGDERLREYVNHWIEVRRRNGTLDRLYEHWILGGSPEADSKRWSVVRDVLHWVD